MTTADPPVPPCDLCTGSSLAHAPGCPKISCLVCLGPLVPCDCQPDCPGGMCAARCDREPTDNGAPR